MSRHINHALVLAEGMFDKYACRKLPAMSRCRFSSSTVNIFSQNLNLRAQILRTHILEENYAFACTSLLQFCAVLKIIFFYLISCAYIYLVIDTCARGAR